MQKKAETTEHKADFAHLTGEQPIVQPNGDSKARQTGQVRDSLAARLKAGERAAANELVDTYYEQIYLFMRRLGHGVHVSEDLTQESFIQAWFHINQLRDGKALNGWLYRIAVNASRLHWRRGKGRKIANIDRIDLPDRNNDEGDIMERNEQLEKLRNAVLRLPEKLRQAVALHYMQYLTIAESAEAAGIRVGTFKSRLNRALKALRKTVT